MKEIRGYSLVIHKALDSTQDYCRHLIEEGRAYHGFVIRTHNQLKGRATKGKTWLSGENDNIAMTLILERTDVVHNNCILTQLPYVVATAIGESILTFSPKIDLSYKWVNDVLVNGKKIAGVLVEIVDENYCLVGIGINVDVSPSDKELQINNDITKYSATSLHENEIEISAKEFLDELLIKFKKLYNIWCNQGFSYINKLWHDSALYIGENIRVQCLDQLYEGIFAGLDNKGQMILKLEDNSEKIVVVGDIIMDFPKDHNSK